MPGLLQPERRVEWSPDGRLIACETRSLFTGKWNRMECDPSERRAITRAQWDAWQGGEYIQRAMPQLSDEEREFLLTGATPQEWDAAFPEEDDAS